MSPRRSSRARSSQQPTAPSQAGSTSSSSTNLKDSRNARPAPPNSSMSEARLSVHRSESVDDADSMARSDQHAPRRSRRGVEAEKDIISKAMPLEDDDDEQVVEDDITRCICGHAEYPGPSVSIRERFGAAALTEDMGNFFVQCDNCHVWQHGGCLGIHDESIIPDEYYCEKCRPDFHKVIKANNISTKSSRYLPVLEGNTRTTPLTPAEQARMKDLKDKALANTKRRATMNSRGAYDEDEMLRQAIEESKADNTLGKRGRDDNDDRRPSNKRQRTGESVSDSSSKKSGSPEPILLGKNGTKLRGAAARNNREKEMREKIKQEALAQRTEAANKRNARSERRRIDESPPPTPGLSPLKAGETKASKGKGETPQPGKSKGKGGARPGVRGKRVGRNQYTRDFYDPSDTPHRSTSHDRNGHYSPFGINGESGRSSKARTHPARTSLNEMKKRVAAILEFVSQMQTHQNKLNSSIPNSSGSGSNSKSSGSGKGNSTPSSNSQQLATSKLIETVTAALQEFDPRIEDGKVKFANELDFGKMDSGPMMEILMKELVCWQGQFGVYSR